MLLLKEIQKKIEPVAKEYGVEKVYLFGSYARKEADDNSDVDLRIDKGLIRGLDLVGFIYDIESALGKNVDVVTTKSLGDDFLQIIKSEEVLLYESRQ